MMNNLNNKFLVHSDFAGCLPFDKDDCLYSSCYCEENVYKLSEQVKEQCCDSMIDKCFAVFVSNDERRVPLWQQTAGNGPDKLVFWDYHVFLLLKSTDTSLVYDFDTCLTFPSSANDYFIKTFKSDRFLENSRCSLPVFVPNDRTVRSKVQSSEWFTSWLATNVSLQEMRFTSKEQIGIGPGLISGFKRGLYARRGTIPWECESSFHTPFI
ncbi:hypothetical protein LSTR_LSTR014157 [Laodelphax striatellus]|uniref:Protein N-terminal glutamine amidohydrolase n=1 Tax=Laodelphax striatellus TaxID=195883 RepID=A0A482XQ32_LAOST|nr:hypothetical protein LSTR_LSTR014157 [Laodelphax striatellus]